VIADRIGRTGSMTVLRQRVGELRPVAAAVLYDLPRRGAPLRQLLSSLEAGVTTASPRPVGRGARVVPGSTAMSA
jgi:hypothetical protein